MARMAMLVLELDQIDTEIQRLHDHAVDPKTEEFNSLLDEAQIDALLERRYRLYPADAKPT